MNSKYVNSLIKFVRQNKDPFRKLTCNLNNTNTSKNITRRDCTGIHCSHCLFNKSVSINLIETSKNE